MKDTTNSGVTIHLHRVTTVKVQKANPSNLRSLTFPFISWSKLEKEKIQIFMHLLGLRPFNLDLIRKNMLSEVTDVLSLVA